MVVPSAKQFNGGRQIKSWQVTIFFYSHFSYSFGECDMWKIFQRRERVEEVFISRKIGRE